MSNEMKQGGGGRPGTNMTVDEVTTMVLTALGSNSRHNDPNKSDLNELTSNLNYIAFAATSSPPRRLPVLDALISADAFHAINTLRACLAGLSLKSWSSLTSAPASRLRRMTL